MIARWIFRWIPWWLYGLLALGLLPLFATLLRDHLVLREEVAIARALPPPLEPLYQGGALPGPERPLREFHSSGRILASGTFVSGKSSKAFVLIGPPGGRSPAIALVVPHARAGWLKSALLAAKSADGMVEISGYLDRPATNRIAVTTALQDRDLVVPAVLATAEPWFGDRDAALDDRLTSSLIIIVGVGVLTLLLCWTTVAGFRAWRRRRGLRSGNGHIARANAAELARIRRRAASSPWGSTGSRSGKSRMGTPRKTADLARPRPVKPAQMAGPARSTGKPGPRDRFAASAIETQPQGWLLRWFSR